MGSLMWSSSGASSHLEAAVREWFGHAAGVTPLWLRLTAPVSVLAIGLSLPGGGFSIAPLITAPVAAGLYAAAYVIMRKCVQMPLNRLKVADTGLLVTAVAGALALTALWWPPTTRWLAPVQSLWLLSVSWHLNWRYEAPASVPPQSAAYPATKPPVFVPPVLGPITAGYRSYDRSHTGVDVGVPPGLPVVAPSNGRVVHAGPLHQWGYCVRVDHGGGWHTLVAHLGRVLVRKGDCVVSGQTIALSGASGISTGPHVHVELQYKGSPVDPNPLLPTDRQRG